MLLSWFSPFWIWNPLNYAVAFLRVCEEMAEILGTLQAPAAFSFTSVYCGSSGRHGLSPVSTCISQQPHLELRVGMMQGPCPYRYNRPMGVGASSRPGPAEVKGKVPSRISASAQQSRGPGGWDKGHHPQCPGQAEGCFSDCNTLILLGGLCLVDGLETRVTLRCGR